VLPEADITCPWCWERQRVVVDSSAGSCQYVQDCAVCCRPMLLEVHADDAGTLLGVDVARE